MKLTKWVILLAIVAAFDLLSTYLCLGSTIELNPLFINANIETMALSKIGSVALIIWLSLHFKQKICLMAATGINLAAVGANIVAILLMC